MAVDFRGRVNDLYGGRGIYVVIRTKAERVGVKADDEDQLSNDFEGHLVTDTEKGRSRWCELPHGLKI